MYMGRFGLLLLMLLVIFTIPSPVKAAETGVQLFVNDRPVTPELPPLLTNGRVLLPLRFLAELTGTAIDYNPAKQTIVLGPAADPAAVLAVGSTLAQIDGQPVLLDVPPRVANGRTLVPLRFVATALNIPIHWDGASRSVLINLDKAGAASQSSFSLDLRLVPIGTPANLLEIVWGRPQNRGRDLAGLEWWTYRTGMSRLVRIGIANNKIAAAYATGAGWSYGTINNATGPGQAAAMLGTNSNATFTWQGGTFTFVCNDNGRHGQMPPAVDGDRVVILYNDEAENRVTAVLVMEISVLMTSDPLSRTGCDIRYSTRVPLPAPPILGNNLRQSAELHEARALFDLVNLERNARNLPPLTWQEAIARVARSHSQDMAENGFFNHQSPTTGAPVDRMLAAGINPCGVAENIAAGYVDAPSTHHAWMNSPGHRRNILEPQVRHFGAGIFQKHFTENFTVCLRPS